MAIAIRFENVAKRYRLGEVSTGTLSQDLERMWARFRGKPDPFAKVGQPLGLEAGGRGAQTAGATEFIWALQDISFEVCRGEVLGIIGHNGAGKSTLLKLLSRVTAPTVGKIRARGRIASLLEVGTGFHPELTGRENIFLNGAILGMTRQEIRARFDQIVEFSGCERYIDTPVKRYSSGMTVRLGFSVAAHLQCEILVVDEVLAVGDLEFQSKCIGKMQEVSGAHGRTVLFVSHNLSSVQRLCERSVILEQGCLAFAGPTATAIQRYSSAAQQAATVELAACNQYGPREYGKLTHCTITDDQRQPTLMFPMGSAIRVSLTYCCERPLSNAEIGVKLSTVTGSPIHYFPTTWEGIQLNLSPGTHQYEVSIPGIQLLPGKYAIGAWVLKAGANSDHNLPAIATIEIIAADINGHHPDFARYATGAGESYWPCQWRQL